MINANQLNSLGNFLRFQYTWVFKRFVQLHHKMILLVYGNQSGKTGSAAYQYVMRILGLHPIARKNVTYYECENDHSFAPYGITELICKECGSELKVHRRESRVFRFCSETLPGQTSTLEVDGGTSEVKNTQYPEFKKWLPPNLIKKDITVRNPAMTIIDPYGQGDIVVEFVSYNQSTQATAGVQRLSIWCDESPSKEFYDEQLPRLLAENGDIIFTYTPVDRSSWLFDEIYDKASVIYRSKYIVDFLSKPGLVEKAVEKRDTPYDIAVIMAATDDNPTLKKEVIDALFNNIDDPDVVAIRRYGIFKQLSGRIFKDFDYGLHILPVETFPDGVPKSWTHFRGIDFHPQTPWAFGMISISPDNEAFIWGEWNPSPEKFTSREIARQIAISGKDYKFRLNLIDPLAKATKKDNITVLDDLNEEFRNLSREGIGTSSYWDVWDTHGERGRDALRERLKNSITTKRPFNNKGTVNGRTEYLPTLWILSNCKDSIKAMHNWRWEEWASTGDNTKKDAKNKPEQKWSHFNMVWEAAFKEPAFRSPTKFINENQVADYFKRRN